MNELEQLTLFSSVPSRLRRRKFALVGGGTYRVVERNGSWDTIFCEFGNGESAYMTQTVWLTDREERREGEAA